MSVALKLTSRSKRYCVGTHTYTETIRVGNRDYYVILNSQIIALRCLLWHKFVRIVFRFIATFLSIQIFLQIKAYSSLAIFNHFLVE